MYTRYRILNKKRAEVYTMSKIKSVLKSLSSFFLTNERINSQTCVAKGIDTNKLLDS